MNNNLARLDLSALKAKVAVAASVTVQKCAVSAEAGLREHRSPMRLSPRTHRCVAACNPSGYRQHWQKRYEARG